MMLEVIWDQLYAIMLVCTCTFLNGDTMHTLTYTSLRENLADALERVEKGETIEITRKGHQPVLLTPKNISATKTVAFASQEKFNAAFKLVQKTHAKSIKDLADR